MNMVDLGIVGLLAVAIVIILAFARVQALPKKGIPYLAAALLPVLGYAVFRKYLTNDQLREAEKKEKALLELDDVIRGGKIKTKAESDKLQEIRNELADMKAAHEQNVLAMNEKRRQQDAALRNLSDEEYLVELKKMMGR